MRVRPAFTHQTVITDTCNRIVHGPTRPRGRLANALVRELLHCYYTYTRLRFHVAWTFCTSWPVTRWEARYRMREAWRQRRSRRRERA